MSTVSDTVDVATSAATSAVVPILESTAAQRAVWLDAVADALDGHRDELVAVADEETALGVDRLRGEVGRTTGQLRLFARAIVEGSYLEVAIDHADASATPPRPDLRRMLRPIGPIAVFAASNFPFAFSVAGGDTASALAAGCPVIVKAHPGHTRLSRLTATIVSNALAEAGAPAGTFALVDGYDAGVELVQSAGVAGVAFTGSVRGGRALHDLAAARPAPIPFFGELGSVNPVVVTRAADAARGAELAAGLAASFSLGAGQFCTKPGVVFVPRNSTLAASIVAPVGGQRLLTEAIDAGFREGLEDLLSIAGVTVLSAGNGAGPQPTIIEVDVATLAAHARKILAEVFGPVTVLVTYGDDDSLREALGYLEGTLTATLHAEASDDTTDIVRILTGIAGRVLFSGWPTGVAVAWAQHHGGPWPATTSQHTSVGVTAIRRFLRPIAYQDAPEAILPRELVESNPLSVPRRVDGVLVTSAA